jgi:hypothetical protein
MYYENVFREKYWRLGRQYHWRERRGKRQNSGAIRQTRKRQMNRTKDNRVWENWCSIGRGRSEGSLTCLVFFVSVYTIMVLLCLVYKRSEVIKLRETSSSHSGEYESQNLLGCTAMFLIGCRPTFQMCVLPPSSGWWVSLAPKDHWLYRSPVDWADQ